ncbi:hypothetical protein D3C73_383920 [compost metagenome]
MPGKQVHALDDRLLDAVRKVGLRVFFVHQGDVVELVHLTFQHLTHAVIENHREFTGERRVVGAAVGDHRRHQVAVAVLMLQPFPTQCRAPCRSPEQKASGPLIRRRPDQVADALEAEHRVIDVERQHRQAMHRVTGRRGHPGTDRPGLADALFQNLAVERFPIAENRTDVFRLIALADAGINPDLLEQAGHAERPRFIRYDRHDARPQLFVPQQTTEHAHERHGGGHFLAFGGNGEPGITVDLGDGQ